MQFSLNYDVVVNLEAVSYKGAHQFKHSLTVGETAFLLHYLVFIMTFNTCHKITLFHEVLQEA